MKLLTTAAILCALGSMIVIFASWSVSFIPGPTGEMVRVPMMLMAGLGGAAWLALAIWLQIRTRRNPQASSPMWLFRLLLSFATVYLTVIFLLIAG